MGTTRGNSVFPTGKTDPGLSADASQQKYVLSYTPQSTMIFPNTIPNGSIVTIKNTGSSGAYTIYLVTNTATGAQSQATMLASDFKYYFKPVRNMYKMNADGDDNGMQEMSMNTKHVFIFIIGIVIGGIGMVLIKKG